MRTDTRRRQQPHDLRHLVHGRRAIGAGERADLREDALVEAIRRLGGARRLFRDGPEEAQEASGTRIGNTARPEFRGDAVRPDLVQLVQGHERVVVQARGHAARVQQRAQHTAMVQPERVLGEAEPGQHVACRPQEFRLHHHRPGPDGVHVALVELAEAALLRAIGAPHRLDLVPLEELRQLRAVLGHDPRERHRQVVAQGEVGLPRLRALAALEDLEDEAVALFAVLAEERLDVLDGRRLDGLEPVALVHVGDDADDVSAPPHVGGQEVAHAARRTGVHDW